MTETLHIFAQDISPEESWRLLQWCLGKGADEFSLNVIGFQETIDQAIKQFDDKFDGFRINRAPRRTLTSLTGKDWIRPIELWRLNEGTIVRLQEILPAGIFTDEIGDTWYEDLYVYRGSELIMGVVTHEQEGILRVTAEEKKELDQLGIKYVLKGNGLATNPKCCLTTRCSGGREALFLWFIGVSHAAPLNGSVRR